MEAVIPVLILSVGDRELGAARALAERLRRDGVQVAASEAVAPDALGAALESALADPGIGCVLVVGGTGLAADGAAVAAARAAGEVVGAFDGLFRWSCFQRFGAPALFARAALARAGHAAIAALPDHAEAAVLAWESLVAPNLEALGAGVDLAPADGEADGEAGGPEPVEEARLEGGVHVVAIGGGSAPGPDEDAPPPRWRAALAALGATLDRETWAELPEALDRLAAARDVLLTAGERGRVRLADGSTAVALGFPDLLRPGSKVLLVRDAEPRPEVIALHRHPRRVGLVTASPTREWLPATDWDPDPVAERLAGRPAPGGGVLFAVEADAVYLERGGRVVRWDGRRERDEGTPSQAMASLVLRWSSR